MTLHSMTTAVKNSNTYSSSIIFFSRHHILLQIGSGTLATHTHTHVLMRPKLKEVVCLVDLFIGKMLILSNHIMISGQKHLRSPSINHIMQPGIKFHKILQFFVNILFQFHIRCLTFFAVLTPSFCALTM